jgi:hypothetical protein
MTATLTKGMSTPQNRPNIHLVLVIDALDESGDPRTRAPLLRYFSEICAHIDWVKIVVTSRPEHDISQFSQNLHLVGHDLAEDDQAHEDIRTFARYRMGSLAKQYHLGGDWPGESRLEQIARRSGGLFMFVETLYQFLDDPDPELLLTEVLGGCKGLPYRSDYSVPVRHREPVITFTILAFLLSVAQCRLMTLSLITAVVATTLAVYAVVITL